VVLSVVRENLAANYTYEILNPIHLVERDPAASHTTILLLPDQSGELEHSQMFPNSRKLDFKRFCEFPHREVILSQSRLYATLFRIQ
jgi:hypothetical protein